MRGTLRARGIRVIRECVHTLLRTIDPISSALRWPTGATKHRPYSVAGPNSLWHIGTCTSYLLYSGKVFRINWRLCREISANIHVVLYCTMHAH